MTTLTSSLIVRLIDQVSGPARGIGRNLLGIQRAAEGTNNVSFGQRLNQGIRHNQAALDGARAGMVDAVAGFYTLRTAIGAPIREAMLFESAMADVRKVVDFPTPEAFSAFQSELMEMSRRIPVAVTGLADIAAAAGQAGIAGEDLTRFTEAAAKVGVAFDISADQAGESMAKMMTGLGLTIDETVLLADSMNHLSNNQASSAAEILDVVRRVGAQGQGYGFAATEVAAFASAMVAAGAESEVAATSFRNMGLRLTLGASATSRQQSALRRLGLDATDVARRMQDDAVGTTIDVIERLNEMPAEMRSALQSDIFGNEAQALGYLIENLDLLKRSLGLVDDASNYAGSSFEEFEVRAGTFENAVQLLGNRLTGLKIVIGNAIIPAINDLIDSVSPAIDNLTLFAQAHPDVIKYAIGAASALISFKIAANSLRFIGLIGRGGALSMVSLGFNTVGRASMFLGRSIAQQIALDTALAGSTGRTAGVMGKLRSAFGAIANMRAIRWATFIPRLIWRSFIRPLQWTSGIIPRLPWRQLVGFLNWRNLIRPFSWASQFIPRVPWLRLAGVLRWSSIIRRFSWSSRFVTSIPWANLAGRLSWRSLLTPLRWSSRLLPGIGWAVLAGELAWNFLIKPFGWDEFLPSIDWGGILGSLEWSGIIPSVNIGDFITWPEPPAWWNYLFGDGANNVSVNTTSSIQAAPVGVGPNRRFAAGGSFSRGSILVGERGPEVRYEDRSGYIAHHGALRDMMELSRQIADEAIAPVVPDLPQFEMHRSTSIVSTAGNPTNEPAPRPPQSFGPITQTLSFGDIHIRNSQDINDVVDQASARAAENLRNTLDGLFADGDP